MRGWGAISIAVLIGSTLPVLADDASPICPDRPGKGTSPCTVDAGHLQLEVGLYDGQYQRRGGITTDDTSAGAA